MPFNYNQLNIATLLKAKISSTYLSVTLKAQFRFQFNSGL